MKHLIHVLFLICATAMCAQEHSNIELVSNVRFDENGSDIWGYVDAEGTEYAIMGTRTATRIFSLEDPKNPIERAVIRGAASIWRDIKSFKDHLYVTTDQGADGLLIIDMAGAPENITHKYWRPEVVTPTTKDTINKCHNIYIDTDQGFAYLAGCNVASGAIILDLNQDLDTPTITGVNEVAYAHDIYTRDNIMYSSEINRGLLSSYDVSDKSKPKLLSSSATTTNFTHNAWLSDDKKYLFTTDEKPNAAVDAFDVSDPNNMEYISSFRPAATVGSGVIPHNTHYDKGFIVTSWYTDGVIITDVQDPSTMVEVGNYDSWDGPHGGFNGCWGAYPYLPSGLLIISDINTGLYVLQPKKANGENGYQRASYLAGKVLDIRTNEPIPNATVTINGTKKPSSISDPAGNYKLGYAGGGEFQIIVSHAQYDADTSYVTLQEGELVTKEIKLGNVEYVFNIKNKDGEPVSGAHVVMRNTTTNSYVHFEADENGQIKNRLSGSNPYEAYISAWGYIAQSLDFAPEDDKKREIILDKGYSDPFVSDLGWKSVSDATTGKWERETDMKQLDYNGTVLQPEGGASDIGNTCYVTEKNTGSLGSNDIDDGEVMLTSPSMDFTGDDKATINYAYFFIYLENENSADDKMTISITNGTEEFILREIEKATPVWRKVSDEFTSSDIAFTDDMRLVVKAGDYGNPHFVEAYFDDFSAKSEKSNSLVDGQVIDIDVRPNPFDNNLELYGEEAIRVQRLEIYSMDGKRIATKHNLEKGQNIVDGIDLRTGIYTIRLVTDKNEVKNIRITKK